MPRMQTTMLAASLAATALSAQAGTYKQLYAFVGGADGARPVASLINVSGTFYGTTENGGTSTACGGGCGTVFSITPAGSEKVIYTFQGDTDAGNPEASLTAVGGLLYGTAYSQGSLDCTGGCGAVFSVDPTTGLEQLPHVFVGGNNDGARPTANLINVNGTLYGTTIYAGGSANCGGEECGVIFSVVQATGAEAVVHAFQGGSGPANPAAGVIKVGGKLYGTSYYGGNGACTAGCGTVFSLNLKTGTQKVLHAFQGGSDGAKPSASLLNVKGTLYGTTGFGGGNARCGGDCGAIFSVVPATRSEKIVHAFAGAPNDGATPLGNLINVNGMLYGTTSSGGTANLGTIFALDPATGVEKVLYSFAGGKDGANPSAGLTRVGRVLYGTTTNGGSATCSGGCGTVFSYLP